MYIYSIRCKTNDNVIQIGSTKQTLNKRWSCHKSDCKNKNYPLYKYIRENGGIDNFYIELYEEAKKCTKQELEKREGEIIRELKKNPEMVVLNHNIAGNTQGLTKNEYMRNYMKDIYYKDPVNAERNRDKTRDYYNIPVNADRNRIRMKETMRKKSGYYNKNPSESSSDNDIASLNEVQDLILAKPDN